MILCSCTVLTRAQLNAIVTDMLKDDPYAVITPGKLFHACGRRMECARCASLVDAEIAKHLIQHGRQMPAVRKRQT